MADTYNPIIGKEEIPRLRLFQPRPTPEPGVALVLFREGQPPVTLWPGDRLTAGEVRWGNYKVVYKVDVTEHSFSSDCTLPCESDAFDFHAEVQVTWAVDDPALIVERNVTDARTALEPLIIRTMRSVSRRYGVEASSTAEEGIIQAVENETYDVGIKLNRFVVELRLEKDARDYIRKQEEIRRRTILDKAEIGRQREVEAAQATLGEERRKFREAEDQWERERKKLEEQAELERQKMRMEFYGPLIEKGNWQLLAFHLANHPDDVPGVIQTMRQQRQIELEYNLKALEGLLAKAGLEEWEVQEPAKELLRHIASVLKSEVSVPALGEGREPKSLPRGEREEPIEQETKESEGAGEIETMVEPRDVEDNQVPEETEDDE